MALIFKKNQKAHRMSIFSKSNQFHLHHKSLKYTLWNGAAKMPINFIYLDKHFQYLYKRPEICRITCCLTSNPSIPNLMWLIALVVAIAFLIRFWWMEIFSFLPECGNIFYYNKFNIHEYIEIISQNLEFYLFRMDFFLFLE